MLLAFGDVEPLREDTVELLEAYLLEFIRNLLTRAYSRSQRRGSRKVQLMDILKMIEQNDKQFMRVPAILLAINNKKNVKDMEKGADFANAKTTK